MNINISGITRVSSVQLLLIGCRHEFAAHFINSIENQPQYKSIFYDPSIKRQVI